MFYLYSVFVFQRIKAAGHLSILHFIKTLIINILNDHSAFCSTFSSESVHSHPGVTALSEIISLHSPQCLNIISYLYNTLGNVVCERTAVISDNQ